MTLDRTISAFADCYEGSPEWVVRAPGRVNLIGEHTDYNDGFVMPMAIDRAVYIAGRNTGGDQVRIHSVDFGEESSFSLSDVTELTPAGDGWLEYVKGTAWALDDSGRSLAGWEGVLLGDVPVGAGLSSSAAVELAVARAFQRGADWSWDAAAMALLGQRAENRWVGVNCGIMDQMISACGKDGHALLLDCRSLEGQHVPLPNGVAVVVLDTGTRRGLVDSAYNERRAQCEAAARFFSVGALRDVDEETFADRMHALGTKRRAVALVTSLARMRAQSGPPKRCAKAMRRGWVCC